jgi:ABC-type multidrug transport system fused ATPase/permease subunit
MLFLYVIVIAWLYVVVLMAASVATSPTGSVLAAIMTLFFYGLLPLALMVYLMTGKLRRKARSAAETSATSTSDSRQTEPGAVPPPEPSSPNPSLEDATDPSPEPDSSPQADAGRHAPTGAEHSPIAPVRKEP